MCRASQALTEFSKLADSPARVRYCVRDSDSAFSIATLWDSRAVKAWSAALSGTSKDSLMGSWSCGLCGNAKPYKANSRALDRSCHPRKER